MQEIGSEVYGFGAFCLDTAQRLLTRDGREVPLAPKTFDLLQFLVENRGRLLTKSELMSALWPNTIVEEINLAFQISTLRKALSPEGAKLIETAPKHGYRFLAEVHVLEPEQRTPGRLRRIAGTVAERPRIRPVFKRVVWFGLAICCTVMGLTLFYVTSRAHRSALKVVPFTTLPGWESEPAFSPDGRQIAFVWNGEGRDNFDIYIKGVDSGVPLRLTNHSGEDRNPVWSPDGQRLAFVRRFQGDEAVFIVPVTGGSERRVHTLTRPLVLCPVGVSCLSWSPDEDSLAIVDKTVPGNAQSMFILSLSTLKLRQITYPSTAQSWGDVSPAFSPDGRKLAFVRWSTTGSDVFITSVAGGEPTRVTSDKRILFSVDWTPDGRELVFSSDRVGSGGIWAVPVSGGHPRQVVATTESSLVSVARGAYRLAYAKVGIHADSNIWQTDLTKPADPATRLIASTQQEMSPEFSPDGDRIVFNSTRSGSFEIWMSDRDGRNPVQLTAFAGPHAGSPRWSPDARTIAFDAQSTRSSDADIYVIDIDARLPRRLTSESSEDIVPCWSEDGRSIYFGSTRSGDWQIWKIPAQGGEAVQVTTSGGVMTVGVQNRFVYYLKNMESRIWRVPEQGGREEAVLNTPEFHYSRYAALSRGGIYFSLRMEQILYPGRSAS